MSEKILVTGAKGQLGIELSKRLRNAVLTDVDKLDITDFADVQEFIKKNKIGVIVNAAAYTAVDAAEDDDVTAYKVNVLGPENLAKTGCKIVHISTDYVFDGKGYKPYMPQDVTNPLSVYGKTKLKGEEAVLKNAKEAVILRTAWLYSANGKNFVKTMLRLGSEKEQIGVVADQIGTPTYAGDLADAIVKILPQISTKTKGVYHFTNEGVCSWYDFATAIMEMAKLKCKVEPLPSSAYPTKAVRPFYSVLDKTSVKEQFGLKIPYWRVSLKKCIKELTK
ncbi:MAG: dTDP-4-dehydrorhamnose reductase [Alphaproteobacteria bacterium]|nr:dTDP-4-dehydrorhamnose reductase [Alphaproteobacteria bacterium]